MSGVHTIDLLVRDLNKSVIVQSAAHTATVPLFAETLGLVVGVCRAEPELPTAFQHLALPLFENESAVGLDLSGAGLIFKQTCDTTDPAFILKISSGDVLSLSMCDKGCNVYFETAICFVSLYIDSFLMRTAVDCEMATLRYEINGKHHLTLSTMHVPKMRWLLSATGPGVHIVIMMVATASLQLIPTKRVQ